MSRIYLSNSANQEFRAIIIPSGDWKLADIYSAPALEYFIGFNSLNYVNDLMRIYKNSSKGIWCKEFARSINQFFEHYGLRISAGESKELHSKNMSYPHAYLSIANWGRFSAASSWLILILSKDGNWTNSYSSNDDWSWITQGKGNGYESVRSKPGKVWQCDAEAGQHNFDQVRIKSDKIEPLSV